METERFETVVIGGGQAGLKAGYYLAKAGRPFVILDANERTGDAWRKRWDSLRLFTPARFNGLPGWKYPARPHYFPTKDEMADYLEAYAARFKLPIRHGVSVDRVTKEDDRFVITSGGRRFEADNVVVATGANRVPKMPAFAAQLDSRIVQMHSSEYKNPTQLRDGGVLVVGVGNSGAEIAYELVQSRPTWLAGKESGQIPVPHGGQRARMFFPVFRFVGHFVLSFGTPIGRKVIPKMRTKADPLIRRRTKDLAEARIDRVPRVAGVGDGLPVLEDGRTLDVPNVIWSTGYRYDFSWIDLPAFEADGVPIHTRGVSTEPGLYFVGLSFQYSASSEVLPGRGRDAEFVVKHLAGRDRSRATDRVPA
ncbi:MAG: NAD(P)-binding domain-containing protein [Actinomycetota bacterium]